MGYNPFNTLVIDFSGTRFGDAVVKCRLDFSLEHAERLTKALFPTEKRVVNGAERTVAAEVNSVEQYKLFAREILVEWNLENDDKTSIPADEAGVLVAPVALMKHVIETWSTQVYSPLVPKSSAG